MAELPSVRGLEPVAIPHRVVDPLLLGEDVRVGEQFDADRTPDILTVDHGPPPGLRGGGGPNRLAASRRAGQVGIDEWQRLKLQLTSPVRLCGVGCGVGSCGGRLWGGV